MRRNTPTVAATISSTTSRSLAPWALAAMAGLLSLAVACSSGSGKNQEGGSGQSEKVEEGNGGGEGSNTSGEGTEPEPVKPDLYTFQVVAEYDHDKLAFTQGLFFHNGFLYESTGRNGTSTMRKVELETGQVLEPKVRLPFDEFGEGACLHQGRVYQITWKQGRGYVYDPETLQELYQFNYPGEGWGLTSNGADLFMSDGSAYIRRFRLDGDRFQLINRLRVTDGEERISNLNELEWVGGEIWANIWKDDRIARIDPETGDVVGWLEMTGLQPTPPSPPFNPENVLNGIAYDSDTGRIFVTGKLWPKLYEIQQVRR